MKAKYIVYRGFYGLDVAIIFDCITNHSDVANALNIKDRVLGAGEMGVYANGNKTSVSCWGESTTLGVKSRGKEDAKEVLRTLFPELNDRIEYTTE